MDVYRILTRYDAPGIGVLAPNTEKMNQMDIELQYPVFESYRNYYISSKTGKIRSEKQNPPVYFVQVENYLIKLYTGNDIREFVNEHKEMILKRIPEILKETRFVTLETFNNEILPGLRKEAQERQEKREEEMRIKKEKEEKARLEEIEAIISKLHFNNDNTQMITSYEIITLLNHFNIKIPAKTKGSINNYLSSMLFRWYEDVELAKVVQRTGDTGVSFKSLTDVMTKIMCRIKNHEIGE